MNDHDQDREMRLANFEKQMRLCSKISNFIIEQTRITDRELLELAAKAAGLHDLTYFDEGAAGGKGMRRDELDWDNWNPLDDDGDALRLAIQIGTQGYFGLEVQPTCVQATCLEPWEHCEYEEYKTQDPYAATRRAIVRAAAEIGRAM